MCGVEFEKNKSDDADCVELQVGMVFTYHGMIF